jgi:hypothetical protein
MNRRVRLTVRLGPGERERSPNFGINTRISCGAIGIDPVMPKGAFESHADTLAPAAAACVCFIRESLYPPSA